MGSPPNGIFARFVEDRYGEPVSFLAWMRVSLPVTLLLLPATYFVLTKLLFRTKLTGIPGGKEWVKNEIAKLGPMSAGEKVVLVVFALAALLWMCGPLVRGFEIDGVRPFKALSDEAIAMGAGLILFMIPIDVKRGVHALDWDSTKDVVAWDVLLLFGGGLTMAAAIQATGLADLIGAQASVFAGASRFSMMLGVSALTTFASEVTSNTALAATIMPLIAAVILRFTGWNRTVCLCIVMVLGCSVATVISIFGVRYDRSPEMASKSVLQSNLLLPVTMPLMMFIAERIL